ncbi:MAG: DUF4878 domain-containing protein [Chitinophagaceae bacterium]|nr:DUF4878 domain-containing protein [Chitinophagaceae bacterium]
MRQIKRYNSYFLFVALLFLSCNTQTEKKALSENHLDAARNFIRAALDGDFKKAKEFLLKDSVNLDFLNAAERSFQKTDPASRENYKNASINIHESIKINDSVYVCIFSNSFKKDRDTLKVVKSDNDWLVDLKYLYLHDNDSLIHKTPPNR